MYVLRIWVCSTVLKKNETTTMFFLQQIPSLVSSVHLSMQVALSSLSIVCCCLTYEAKSSPPAGLYLLPPASKVDLILMLAPYLLFLSKISDKPTISVVTKL